MCFCFRRAQVLKTEKPGMLIRRWCSVCSSAILRELSHIVRLSIEGMPSAGEVFAFSMGSTRSIELVGVRTGSDAVAKLGQTLNFDSARLLMLPRAPPLMATEAQDRPHGTPCQVLCIQASADSSSCQTLGGMSGKSQGSSQANGWLAFGAVMPLKCSLDS